MKQSGPIVGLTFIGASAIPDYSLASALGVSNNEAMLINAAVWVIKLLGIAASVVLIHFTKRLVDKLEAAVEFRETAPKDIWERFERLEDCVAAIQQRRK